ncbi:hypothetical protein C9412_04545 [Stenotrophomonas sp. Nf1]|nr:hypothetical protein C9412_04545 [Stenotrophomonas sp. Nf1]
MICSSEARFFTSNLLGSGNWSPNCCATQSRGWRRSHQTGFPRSIIMAADAPAKPTVEMTDAISARRTFP